MPRYMVIYNDKIDMTRKAYFTDDKNDARHRMFYVAFVTDRKAQLYEWNNEDMAYSFIWRIEPEHERRLTNETPH